MAYVLLMYGKSSSSRSFDPAGSSVVATANFRSLRAPSGPAARPVRVPAVIGSVEPSLATDSSV